MRPANLLRLLALGSIWGASFLFIKLALAGLSPMQIVLGRLTAGALLLLAVVYGSGQRLPREPRVWGHFAFLGLVSNIVPYFLFGFGEERIPSSLAGVLNATTPLFTLAFSLAALPGERPSRMRVAGLVTGFAGIVVLAAPWEADRLGPVVGQLACLGAAAGYGVGFVWSRRFLTGLALPARVLGTGQIVAATVLGWIVSPWLGRGAIDLTPAVVGSVLALGVGATGVAYILSYQLIREEGATSASLVTYVIPVVSVALGVVLLGEPLAWTLFAGATIVVGGVALAEGRVARLLSRTRGRPVPTAGAARPAARPPDDPARPASGR